jgi:hypothetical protein
VYYNRQRASSSGQVLFFSTNVVRISSLHSRTHPLLDFHFNKA